MRPAKAEGENALSTSNGTPPPAALPPATTVPPTMAPPAAAASAPGGLSDATALMRYDANKKSTLIAYLLWFFLGWFGAHRFYLGRTGSGVAQLVITLVSITLSFVGVGVIGFFVVGIWAFVDAFLIPGITRDHNNRLIALLGR
ncbi:TM2 domain-containing protein [Roseomonas elaeocarpi]|uniref:TM2 domain-containing protein n=1 Tax=Roseomonas elaeocarpi TaxID=907779 RepID=A0ABV6JXX6_9PROT